MDTRSLPETRYTKSGDYSIAYQVVGEGDLDLLWIPGFVSNVELAWDEPLLARYLERLARFSRLILDPLRQARHRTLGPGAAG
jgi:hypothetical protein